MAAVTEGFEAHRRYLFGIAYRMLGSVAEAEDVVQEAFLRWQSVDQQEVRSERALLSTIVTRLCLDHAKRASTQRETYVGPWLPEPIATDDSVDRESISLAFLTLLESLTPVERAAYLLHEVFDYSHAEIAEIVGRSEETCRQLVSRARKAIRERRPRFAPSREAHRKLIEGFASACAAGDLGGLEQLLAEEVTAWSDGGGKAFAAKRPLHGRAEVAKVYLGIFAKAPQGASADVVEINGWPSLLVRIDGAITAIINIETDGDRIFAIRSVVNPDKLTHVL